MTGVDHLLNRSNIISVGGEHTRGDGWELVQGLIDAKGIARSSTDRVVGGEKLEWCNAVGSVCCETSTFGCQKKLQSHSH
jgi:hypothetical protein